MASRNGMLGSREDRNRARMVDLVELVGNERLVFTVYDLQRAQREHPKLAFEGEDRLSAHLDRLLRHGSLVWEVTDLLAPKEWLPESSQEKDPLKGGRRYFVRQTRYQEFLDEGWLTRLDRTYLALWVACESLGEERVPTLAVTRVLRTISALKLPPGQETSPLLRSLQNSSLVALHEVGSKPSLEWEPAGEKPDDVPLDEWVEAFQETDFGGVHVLHAGHASESSALEELARLAIRSTASPAWWPAGKPVTPRDLRAVAGAGGRAGELFDLLLESNRTLGNLLCDASRPRIAGAPRQDKRIVTRRGRYAPTVYYDVPGEPGFDRRQLFVDYEDVKHVTRRAHLGDLSEEHRKANRAWSAASSEEERAIAASRVLLVSRELDRIRDIVEGLSARRGALTEPIAESVLRRATRVDRLARDLQPETWEERAEEALAELDIALDDILAAERPLLKPAEFAAWLSPAQLRGCTPALYANRLSGVRMFDNPDFTSRGADDPMEAAPSCVDRVEALVRAAESSGATTWTFLRAGANLLGRDLRYAPLVRPLLAAQDRRTRTAALAALTLLGDPPAKAHALATLHDGSASAADLSLALRALLVLRTIEPSEWPERLRDPQSRAIQRAVQEVVIAARQGRWLGQR